MIRSSSNEIEFLPGDELQRGSAVRSRHDLMSLAHQPARKHIAIRGIIVDHQDLARSHCLLHGASGVQRLDAAQDVRKDAELPRTATVIIHTRFLESRQREYVVDLSEELISGLFQLYEIAPKWRLVLPLHVLDQQFAIALDGVERIS